MDGRKGKKEMLFFCHRKKASFFRKKEWEGRGKGKEEGREMSIGMLHIFFILVQSCSINIII